MFFNRSVTRTFVMTVVVAAGQALGQVAIDWHSVDGGGGMNSNGGTFSLSGAIGQFDAQVPPVMAGGSFALTGGFWVIGRVCNCPGDLNGDGIRNGADIQKFTRCFTGEGACFCADVDGLGGVDSADLTAFVTDLLAGAGCP